MKATLLNVGLRASNTGLPLSAEYVIGMLAKHGFQVAANTVAQSDTEPTLVAIVMDQHESADARDLALYSVSLATAQDCVAVLPLDGNPGYLEGPRASAWGKFNPQYFIGL